MVDNPRKLVDKHLELAEFERIGNLDTWLEKNGGQGEIRTRDLYNANVTIFQLIYLPSG